MPRFIWNGVVYPLALLCVTTNAFAQSPREQLAQMVAQLQATPTDNALRERIIKLAMDIKPAPAIPDDAIHREGRAKFAFNIAKNNDDFLGAAREYEEAVRLAPWVTGYYSDLCTIYEKAEKYADAKRNCEYFLSGLTDPSQLNETKQRIAGLEFGIEKLAASEQARAVVIRARELEAIKPKVEGQWFSHNGTIDFEIVQRGDAFTIIPGKLMGKYGSWVAPEGVNVIGGRVRFGSFQPAEPQFGTNRYDLTLSANGTELTGTLINGYDGTSWPYVFTRK